MNNWVVLLIVGILSALAGIFALLNPFPATLAVVTLAGWAFLVLGLMQAISAFSAQGWGHKIWALALGIIAFLAGFNLLDEPLRGAVTLTAVLAAVFLASGIVKLMIGFKLESANFKWMVILSGVVSILLALMIFSNFPYSAATILGILLGVELLSNGISSIVLAMSRK